MCMEEASMNLTQMVMSFRQLNSLIEKHSLSLRLRPFLLPQTLPCVALALFNIIVAPSRTPTSSKTSVQDGRRASFNPSLGCLHHRSLPVTGVGTFSPLMPQSVYTAAVWYLRICPVAVSGIHTPPAAKTRNSS